MLVRGPVVCADSLANSKNVSDCQGYKGVSTYALFTGEVSIWQGHGANSRAVERLVIVRVIAVCQLTT